MTKETDRVHSGSQIKPSTLTSKQRARFQDRNKEFEAALVPTQQTIAVSIRKGVDGARGVWGIVNVRYVKERLGGEPERY